MAQPKTAAQALYGHLPSAERAERSDRNQSVADAMWPKLSREQKAREAAQAKWDARLRERKQRLLADLRRR
jgi:hypothetical protein